MKVARYAAAQSLAEVAIGSAIHALHLPLGGQLLSLNQLFLLALATRGSTRRTEAVAGINRIASAAAVFKALSPAGKRLTPMLAISAQGVLFSVGPAVLGPNLLGCLLGGALLSVWSFAQPLLIAYLIFGNSLFEAIARLVPNAGPWLLAVLVGVKIVASLFVVVAGWRCSEAFELSYFDRLVSWARRFGPRMPKPQASAVRGAFKDLAAPWFLLGTGLSVGFFAWGANAEATQLTLYCLRILGCAWLLFWAVRAVPRSWFSKAIPDLEQFSNHTNGDLGGVIASELQADGTAQVRDRGVRKS